MIGLVAHDDSSQPYARDSLILVLPGMNTIGQNSQANVSINLLNFLLIPISQW